MTRSIHVFHSPERFIAGTIGQPGDRTFYVQAISANRIVSVAVEKQQVQILADRVEALLDEVNRRFGLNLPLKADQVDDLSPLVMPIDTEFHVGTMGLGWDTKAKTVVVELLAVYEGEIDESVVLDDGDEGPDAVRVFLTPQAAREFALRSSLLIAAGREPCPLCNEPLDPDGHLCVRLNGYRRDLFFDLSMFNDSNDL